MKKIVLSLMLALALPVMLHAQAPTEEQRIERMQKMTERVAKRLKLASENEEWFKQTYTAYLLALEEVQTMYPRTREVKEDTPNEELLKSIENSFKRSEAEVSVKRTFLAVFSEKLTPAQLHEIFVPARPQRMNGRSGQGGWGGGMPQGGPGFPPMGGF